MALIKSISGIRGTIGGRVGEGLSPLDAVKFTAAYAEFIKERSKVKRPKVIVGRDARISGEMVNHLVVGTLIGSGIDVIDLGLSTTPTVEVAVAAEQAHGGIILTASHNPAQWNALKLLNEKGEFISAAEGETLLQKAEHEAFHFATVESLGKVTYIDDYIDRHIAMVLKLKMVDIEAIRKKKFHVVIDCVNSTGGIVLPKLLTALGVDRITELYCEPNGHFPHNPEPLPEHLTEISETIKRVKGHVGFVVDPDVDRLAMVCENGDMFGEEYTLVAVADLVLSHTKGNTVSNLSSTRALRDVTEKAGGSYSASAVGEVNVVEMMKATNAVVGGEGNGGIILPELHYGRDALVGIALFLTHLANKDVSASRLRASYPNYFISKNKVALAAETNVDAILEAVKEKYKKQPINTVDGVKIEFDKEWVHLRKSNTEPIIRIYCESANESTATNLANKIIADIKEVMKLQAS